MDYTKPVVAMNRKTKEPVKRWDTVRQAPHFVIKGAIGYNGRYTIDGKDYVCVNITEMAHVVYVFLDPA